VAAVLAVAVLAATVRLAPEVASRTLPAISVTVAGRACPKRMKTPYPVEFVAICHPLNTRRQQAPVALLPPVDRAYHCGDRIGTTTSAGAEVVASDVSVRKVNLRIRNVARKMLFVTLPVRSVLLPGP